MDKWQNKVAVVTGSSSGIGAEIAKQLVDAGLKVVGLARRKHYLEKLAGELSSKKGKFYPLVTDVTKEDDVLNGFQWIKTNLGPIHILVNSAGVKRATTLIDGNTKMWKETLDTNLLPLCVVTREAIKSMRESDIDGHIVHINSTTGHFVPPLSDINVYSAVKHGVTALTETLRQELIAIGSKIKITSISPGLVKTELLSPKYIQDYENLKLQPALSPEDVANAILYVLSTPPHVQEQFRMNTRNGSIKASLSPRGDFQGSAGFWYAKRLPQAKIIFALPNQIHGRIQEVILHKNQQEWCQV